MKWCYICEAYKKLSDFYPFQRHRDNGDMCKSCQRQRAKEKSVSIKQESKRLSGKNLFDDTYKKNYLI
jgi:hypothetical protein